MQYYVYILSNITGTTIYIGVTRDLIRRVYEHNNHMDKGSFTDKYDVTRLVYFETTTDIRQEPKVGGFVRIYTAMRETDCHTSLRTGSQ